MRRATLVGEPPAREAARTQVVQLRERLDGDQAELSYCEYLIDHEPAAIAHAIEPGIAANPQRRVLTAVGRP